MDNICRMLLLVFCATVFIHIATSQFNCGPNCLCFDELVDCSRKDLRVMPTFSQYIMLSTQNLLMRHMPDLDLTSLDCTFWPNLKEINLKGSPKACRTLPSNCKALKVVGCGQIQIRISSIATTTTTTTITSTSISTTTTTTTTTTTAPVRKRVTANKRIIVPAPNTRKQHRPVPRQRDRGLTTEEMTTEEGVTPTDYTQAPQAHGLSEDVVITISVLIPSSLVSILGSAGAALCYIQYRKNGGWKWGCIPCRRKGKKLKDSNETINSQDPCAVAAAEAPSQGPGVATLSDKVQDLGCTSMASLDMMEETELFTASPSASSVLPIPQPIPKGKKEAKKGSSDKTRSRPYLTRAAKRRDELDFDPEQTARMAMENKKK